VAGLIIRQCIGSSIESTNTPKLSTVNTLRERHTPISDKLVKLGSANTKKGSSGLT
jgi:hypothetical protein